MSKKSFSNKAIFDVALRIKNAIDSNPLSRATIIELAPGITVGRKKLLPVFKEITGHNYRGYQRKRRIEEAGKMLLKGMSVKQVAIICGYHSHVGNFSRDFKLIYERGPDEWLRNQRTNSPNAQSKRAV